MKSRSTKKYYPSGNKSLSMAKYKKKSKRKTPKRSIKRKRKSVKKGGFVRSLSRLFLGMPK